MQELEQPTSKYLLSSTCSIFCIYLYVNLQYVKSMYFSAKNKNKKQNQTDCIFIKTTRTQVQQYYVLFLKNPKTKHYQKPEVL